MHRVVGLGFGGSVGTINASHIADSIVVPSCDVADRVRDGFLPVAIIVSGLGDMAIGIGHTGLVAVIIVSKRSGRAKGALCLSCRGQPEIIVVRVGGLDAGRTGVPAHGIAGVRVGRGAAGGGIIIGGGLVERVRGR